MKTQNYLPNDSGADKILVRQTRVSVSSYSMSLNPEGLEESGDGQVWKTIHFILRATVADELCEIQQLHSSSERRVRINLKAQKPLRSPHSHPRRGTTSSPVVKGNGQMHQEKQMLDQHEAAKSLTHTLIQCLVMSLTINSCTGNFRYSFFVGAAIIW